MDAVRNQPAPCALVGMATPLTFTIEHKLGKAEAKRRIAAEFGKLGEKMPGFAFSSGAGAWRGDTFPLEAQGYGQFVRGHIDAFDTAVRVTVDVPDMLAPVAKMATRLLEKRARLLLE